MAVGEVIADLNAKKAISPEMDGDIDIGNPRLIPDNRMLFLRDIGGSSEMGYLYEVWTVDFGSKNPKKLAGQGLFEDPMN